MSKCKNCYHGIVLSILPDEMTEYGRVSGKEDYEVCSCCDGDWENCVFCTCEEEEEDEDD